MFCARLEAFLGVFTNFLVDLVICEIINTVTACKSCFFVVAFGSTLEWSPGLSVLILSMVVQVFNEGDLGESMEEVQYPHCTYIFLGMWMKKRQSIIQNKASKANKNRLNLRIGHPDGCYWLLLVSLPMKF